MGNPRLRSAAEENGGRVSHAAKALRKQGARACWKKELPCVTGCRRSGLPFAGFWVAGRIALPLRSAMSEL